jgi:glucuronate isomerase
MWRDDAFHELFGLEEPPSEENAEHHFDAISPKAAYAGVPAPSARFV